MSTERDELAGEISGWPIGSGYESQNVGIDDAREIAEHLIKEGYRKPEKAAPVPDLAGLVREAIDAHHIAASFFTGNDLEALTCVCTDEQGSGDFNAYEAFLAHQAEAIAAHLKAGVSGVAR